MIVFYENGYTVYRTMTQRCACYIIKTNQYSVLIDTSMRFERNSVIRSIEAAGISKIDAIFLTHSHTDHVANARYFSNEFHCSVYVSHKGMKHMIKGCCTMPKGTNSFSRLLSRVEPQIPFYQFTRFEACPQVKPISSEVVKLYLGECLELLETPGHTTDSVSFILDKHIAFVGDAMVHVLRNIYPPFVDDEKAVITSWGALLSTQCQTFCPAHGNPVSREKLIRAYQRCAK